MRYIYFLAFFDEFNEERNYEIRQTIVVPDICTDTPIRLITYAIDKAYPHYYSMIIGVFFEKGMSEIKTFDREDIEDARDAPPCNNPNQITFINSCAYSPEISIIYPTKVVLDFQDFFDDNYSDMRDYKIDKFDDIMPLIEKLKVHYARKHSRIYNITANILDKHNHRWITHKGF